MLQFDPNDPERQRLLELYRQYFDTGDTRAGGQGIRAPAAPQGSQGLMLKKGDRRQQGMTNLGLIAGGQVAGDALSVPGLPSYATGGYNVVQAIRDNKSPTKDRILQGAQGASQIAAGAGVPGAGYVGTGLGAVQIAGSDASPEAKAAASRRLAEDTGLNIASGGVSGLVQLADSALLGGKVNKLRSKGDKFLDSPLGAAVLPIPALSNKLTGKALEKGFSLFGSGKSKDQLQRDAVRKMLKESGFLGDPNAEDWNLENPDGSSFDIGKDGGARLADGRRYSDVDTTKQGAAIGSVNPLAYIITGGNEKLATNFAGYFTNTVTQGAGATDPEIARLNALDKYKKAGLDTADKAIAKIDELLKDGKIDQEKATAFKGGINTVFNGLPTPPQPGSSSQQRPQPRPQPKRPMRTYARNEYTPNVYSAPQVSQAAEAYGEDFANALANVYANNQRT